MNELLQRRPLLVHDPGYKNIPPCDPNADETAFLPPKAVCLSLLEALPEIWRECFSRRLKLASRGFLGFT